MTPIELRHAIRKGHGRAIIFLRSVDPKPYRWVLTRSVLRYPGYWSFTEGFRSEYLTELIEIGGWTDEALELIEHALPRAKWRNRARHLTYIALRLAERGHARAREILRAAFNRRHEEDPFLAADALIELDGLAGFLYVLENLGDRLSKEYEDQLHSLRWELDEAIGEEECRKTLGELALNNPLVSQFVQLLPKEKRYRKSPSLPPMPFKEFFRRRERAKKTGRKPRNLTPARWRKSATDEQYREAAHELERTFMHEDIRKLTRLVCIRPYPLPITKLAKRIKEGDPDDAFFLVQALEGTRRPSVRRLAFELFDDGDRWVYGTGLLRKNFRKGDELVLLELLTSRTNARTDNGHGPIGDVLDFVDRYPRLNWTPHLLWIYENSVCAYCRGSSIHDLIERGEVPREVLEECLWDSQMDTREEAKEALEAGAAGGG